MTCGLKGLENGLDEEMIFMDIRNFQKYCAGLVKKIDRKYNIDRDSYLSFTQLMEEIGELARDVNRPKLRNQKIERENLMGEFADVFLQLCALAEILGIDIADSVDLKKRVLKKRHGIEV